MRKYEKEFDVVLVKEMIQEILSALSNSEQSAEIGLNESTDFEKVWIDSTCIKANIHFPVDWVLLRDAAR